MRDDDFKADGVRISIQDNRLFVSGVLVWSETMSAYEGRERWEMAMKNIRHAAKTELRSEMKRLLDL